MDLSKVLDLAVARSSTLHDQPTIASPEDIEQALKVLPSSLPERGLGTEGAIDFVIHNVLPGLSHGQSGPRYFGFVTGGVLPAAQIGDFLTTIYDQNVFINLPQESVSTVVEQRTLDMILDLLNLPRGRFLTRTLTTGATSSNILGLSCGREHAVRHALGLPDYSIAEDGFGGAIVKVYTDRHHASISKAASVVGIGRNHVVDLETSKGIDFERLESGLKECARGSKQGAIVVLGFGEVNTGDFTNDAARVRQLCDQYGAWLHIDAAFGAFAALVPSHSHLSKDLALADSITSDGIFFARHSNSLTSIYGPSASVPAPAYMSVTSTTSTDLSAEMREALTLPSPFHVNIESSRRFRALSLFCALLAMGRAGYAEIIQRNIAFTNRVARWMRDGDGKRWYRILNATGEGDTVVPLNILLFSASPDCEVEVYRLSSPSGGAFLVKAINETRKMYVSPASGGAVRMAVSNWMTGQNEGQEITDFDIVVQTLTQVMIAP